MATNKLIIENSSGNVGIGTTSPEAVLHVAAATDGADTIYASSNNANAVIILRPDGANGSVIRYGGNGANSNILRFVGVSDAEGMRISGGEVGIGTTTPSAKLHVEGNVLASNSFISAFNTAIDGSAPYDWIFLGPAGNNATRAAAVRIGDIDGANYAIRGGGYGLHFQKHVVDGASRSWSPVMQFVATDATTSNVTVFISNNLGIGTSSPTSKVTISNITLSQSNSALDINASGSGTYQRGIRVLNSSMGSGDGIAVQVGKADSTRNAGQMTFNHISDANTSNYLEFGLHGVDKVLNIAGTGNVGVAITSPAAKLHVSQASPGGVGSVPANVTAILDNTANNYLLFRTSADNNSYSGLIFQDNNVGASITYRNYAGSGENDGTNGDAMYFHTYTDFIFQNGTGAGVNLNPETFRIKQNGNIGINTVTPSAKLHIVGGGSQQLRVVGSEADIWLQSTGGGAGIWRILGSTGATTKLFRIYDEENSANRLVINSSGEIGIGTGSPVNRLHVNGGKFVITTDDGSYGNMQINAPGGGEASIVFGSTGSNQNSGGYTNAGVIGIGAYGNSRDRLVLGTGYSAGTLFLRSGNVSIGTNTPLKRLDIRGNVGIGHLVGTDGTSWYGQGQGPWGKFIEMGESLEWFGNPAVYSNRYGINVAWDSDYHFIGLKYLSGDVVDALFQIEQDNDNWVWQVADTIKARLVSSSGDWQITGVVSASYSFSDRRLKTDITNLDSKTSLDKVLQLQGVNYKWIDGNRKGVPQIGFIAQDVEEVVPEVVFETTRMSEGDGDHLNKTLYKRIDYERMVALLAEAIKEQQKEIEALKQKLNVS